MSLWLSESFLLSGSHTNALSFYSDQELDDISLISWQIIIMNCNLGVAALKKFIGIKRILQAIENMLQRNDSKLCQQQKQQHRINNRNDHGGNNNNNNNNSSNNDSINIVWILWEDEEPYLGDYCFTLDMETDCGIFYGVVQLHLVVSLIQFIPYRLIL